MSKHYIRIDSNNNIIKGFSTDFEQPLGTDICINEDGGRQFYMLGMINPGLMNINGIYLYKYSNNEIVLKTTEEIQAEIDTIMKVPTNEEILAKTIADTQISLVEQLQTLTETIANMQLGI